MLYTSDVTTVVGNWVRGNYATGAGGQAMQSNDAGWSNANEALPAPADYFEARFTPVANKPYRVWMRLRANADSKFNESVWLQFSGAVDANGAPLWRIGTASGMLVNLESCASCGVSGWGWQTGAWWVPQDSIVRFPAATEQTLRVQTREDGARIDQIILSPTTYFDSPPGTPINDTNILAKSATSSPTPPRAAVANARPPTSSTGTANQLPVAVITSPANGATFTAPANIAINATASDSNGSVTRVDFYAGAQLVGTASTAPYSITWSNPPAGTSALTAIALDNGGASGTSSAVSVTINPAGPPLPPPTMLVFTASRDHHSKVTSYSVAIFKARRSRDGTAGRYRQSRKAIGTERRDCRRHLRDGQFAAEGMVLRDRQSARSDGGCREFALHTVSEVIARRL